MPTGLAGFLMCLLCAAAAVAADSGALARAPIGTNLARVDDWSTDMPFTDVFKSSRPWTSGARGVWSDKRPLDLDADGWIKSLEPGQIARTMLFWDLSRLPGKYPAGRYVVDYRGEGDIEYGGSARLVSRTRGRDVIDADPARGGGIIIEITEVNPRDHLRSIRVYLEGSDPGKNLFNPLFLERLRPFKAIRFMDWMATNGGGSIKYGSRQQRWTDRPRPEHARWSQTHGVPLEIMAALANTLKCDVWFNMPHLADDDYVRHFAETTKRLLDPQLRVYVEYSNEVWNRRFAQARHAEAQGQALGLGSELRDAQVRYHAARSVEIFRIWSAVFPAERLVRVFGSQAASSRYSEAALSFRDTARHVDALAIAPYFYVKGDISARGMTLDGLLTVLGSKALPRARGAMEAQRAVARRFRVALIAYEGGQHLVADPPLRADVVLNGLFDAANRDRRMGELYAAYLRDWTAVGGGIFMHFNHVTSMRTAGRFGALEYMSQPREEAPKYDALLRHIEGRP